jgi:uncharacterized SAM-binding protein YcdF (DUF218 family)
LFNQIGNITYSMPQLEIPKQVLDLAQIIWDYHLMHHKLKKADLIWVMGSPDTRVASCSADLFLAGLAPKILFSGGFGRGTKGIFTKPEAEVFAEVAIQKGVKPSQILIETKSSNTGENIRFGEQLLQNLDFPLQSVILIQKPYTERRALATFEKQWTGPKLYVMVTSEPITFLQYLKIQDQPLKIIHKIVGNLQRIKLYPDLGFQSYQPIPENVWDAYQKLLELGFTESLV